MALLKTVFRWMLLFSGMALAAALQAAPASSSAQTASQEYRIKAVFLFNFTQFVDWPSEAFATPRSPFVIGILGEDPFQGALEEAIRGETAQFRPLVVQRFRRVQEVEACHILFVGRSENDRLPEILSALRNRPILTVSDSENFARNGGIVRFFTENSRIRLRINLDAARAANVRISSKLLRHAETVGSPGVSP